MIEVNMPFIIGIIIGFIQLLGIFGLILLGMAMIFISVQEANEATTAFANAGLIFLAAAALLFALIVLIEHLWKNLQKQTSEHDQ